MGGGGSSNKAMTAVTMEQMKYLQGRQKQKEMVTQQMIQTAKQFADLNYGQELTYLDNLRALQTEQLNQQRIIAEQNFMEQKDAIGEEGLLNTIGDANQDFGQYLENSQTNFTRDLGSLQRQGAYQQNETARKLSDAQADASLQQTGNQAEFDKLQNETSFGLNEQQRASQKLTQDQELASGREDALLQYMRGNDQLATDSKLLDVKEAGVKQTSSYQNMSQDLQLYSQLLETGNTRKDVERAASRDKRLAKSMSNSDYGAMLSDQKLDRLIQAQDLATLNNRMMKGSLNNQLDISLAEIENSRLGLQQSKKQIDTQLELDRINRQQTGATNDLSRGLGRLSDSMSMLVMPEVSRRLSMQNAGLQNQGSKMQTGLGRIGEQQGMYQSEMSDEFGRGVQNASNNVNRMSNNMSRGIRDSDLRQRGIENDMSYQQALMDLFYGQQGVDLGFEQGQYAAEQAKYSTEQQTDISALQEIANQRSSLQSALSQIQTGLLGNYTQGAGFGDFASALGGIASNAASLFGNQKLNNAYNKQYQSGGQNGFNTMTLPQSTSSYSPQIGGSYQYPTNTSSYKFGG